MVGNSWTVLKVILGHIYHHNHHMRSISADYSQNLQQKVSCFIIYFCLWLSVSRFMLPFDVWPSFSVTTWTLPYADFGKTIILRTEHSQIAIFSVHSARFLIAIACLTMPLYLAALFRLCSPFAICDINLKQSKTKIYEKITFCCGFRL